MLRVKLHEQFTAGEDLFKKVIGNLLTYDQMNCNQMKSVLTFRGKPFTSQMKRPELLALVNIGPA